MEFLGGVFFLGGGGCFFVDACVCVCVCVVKCDWPVGLPTN